MQITVRDAARLLGTPESSIYRWIDEGAIPVYSVNDEYRFNRAELLHWATAKHFPVSVEAFDGLESQRPDLPELSQAIGMGGVHRLRPTTDSTAMFRVLAAVLPLPPSTDRELVAQAMLSREAGGATLIGDRIAIPHVRSPIVLRGAPPAIVIAFVDPPVRLAKDDESLVETLFTVLGPSVRIHLHLLARLSAALHDPGFRDAIARRASLEAILAETKRVEQSFTNGHDVRAFKGPP